MEGTEVVVEPYYPEWDRGTTWYRVSRIKHGHHLVLSDTHTNAEAAWLWYDGHRFQQG